MHAKFVKRSWLENNSFMLLGLILGLSLFTFNVVGFNFDFFPGDLGDGRLNLYFLEHAYEFFLGRISSFWNASFMYPEKNVLTYSDNLLGSAPIYSMFRLLSFDIYKSYQLWFVVVSALNYITAFYFIRYVFKNNYVAVFGAFIFAFSLALQSQLTHAQTFPRFAIPLAFLMAVKFSEKLDPKYFLLTLFFVVYQIYCGIYLGFMLAIPIGIYLLLIFAKEFFSDGKVIFNLKWFSQITVYCLFTFAVLLPLILPYIGRGIPSSFWYYNQISNSIPTVKSYLFSQQGSLIWDSLSKMGLNYKAWWDHQIFSGGIATISFIIGMFWIVFKLIKTKFNLGILSTPLILILTGLITFFFYLRFNNISAYFVLYFLPGFSSMRSLTRIINVELIFFAIATAFVFNEILKYVFKYKSLVSIAILVLIICDNYFYKDKSYKTEVNLAKERTNKIEKAFSQIPKGSVVSYEPLMMESPSIYYQIDAMLLSQEYDLKTVNGYTATCPGDYGMYWNDPDEKSRNYWLSDKKLNIDTLYVIKSNSIIEKVAINKIKKKLCPKKYRRGKTNLLMQLFMH